MLPGDLISARERPLPRVLLVTRPAFAYPGALPDPLPSRPTILSAKMYPASSISPAQPPSAGTLSPTLGFHDTVVMSWWARGVSCSRCFKTSQCLPRGTTGPIGEASRLGMCLGQVQFKALGLQPHTVGASHTPGPSSCCIFTCAPSRCQRWLLS